MGPAIPYLLPHVYELGAVVVLSETRTVHGTHKYRRLHKPPSQSRRTVPLSRCKVISRQHIRADMHNAFTNPLRLLVQDMVFRRRYLYNKQQA